MKKYQKLFTPFLIYPLILSGFFAYSTVVRYTEFFLRSREDKALLLGGIWLLIFIAGWLMITPVVKKLLIGISKQALLRMVLASAVISALILGIFDSFPAFPKKFQLEVHPKQDTVNQAMQGEITIASMTRFDPPRNVPEQVRFSNLGYNGGWEIKNNSLVYSPTLATTGVVRYTSFIQGEMKVVFLTGPEQGAAKVILNGESVIIDLQDSVPGTLEKTFKIANNWQNADQIRRIMLIGTLLADFVSIFTLTWLVFLAGYQVFLFRKLKMRGFASLALVVLLSFGMGLLSKEQEREVFFPDPGLEASVRSAIGKPDGVIYSHDVLTIIELNLHRRNIKDVRGIDVLRNLRVLNLSNNHVKDLTPLGELKKLQQLDLSSNQLSNISSFTIHSNLEELNLQNNEIEDITPLGQLVALKSLDLGSNLIIDIEPLSKLTRLEVLDLRENRVADVSPLAELSHIEYLNLNTNTGILDISPLAKLTRLESLILRNIPIGDQLSNLENLNQLSHLNLRNTGISTTKPIVDLLSKGALQDNGKNGVRAKLNILDNEFESSTKDPYQELRFYWHNITYRYPYSLPIETSEIDSPSFSKAGGFYEDGFDLKLETEEEGGRIFFTLDGSEPSISDQFRPIKTTREYLFPISIINRANGSNQYAAIETSKMSTYSPPAEIYKSTVVRAVVLSKSGQVSPIRTNTYFIDKSISNRFSLPVLAIATPPEGFFSDEMGIYVPGDLYQNLFPKDMRYNPANYTQRGEIWERPATIQLFDSFGSLQLDQQVGIRIHGGTSRASAQKSLRISVDSDYSDQSSIEFDFFPDLNQRLRNQPVVTFTTLILRTGGGGDWDDSMVRDVIAQGLLENTQLDIQGNYPVLVFINGEYWGIHNLRTRYDPQYFQNYYGVSAEDLVICEKGRGSLYYGDEGDEIAYQEMLEIIDIDSGAKDFITVNTLSSAEKYSAISELMDVDNYIDYYISQIYVHKSDWPSGNISFWKKKIDGSGQKEETGYGHDGKWRWMVIDMDLGFYNPQGNTLELAAAEGLRETYLLRSLLQNQTFKNAFINRSADTLNTIYKEEVVVSKVDEIEALYAPEIANHIQRWGTLGGSVANWRSKIEGIREFAIVRPSILRQYIVDYFGLPGTTRLTVLSDPTKGYVRVNTIEITQNTPGVEDPTNWSGIYFKGVPITLTAISADGYRFSHWEGLTQGDAVNKDLELTLTGDITINAIFSKVP